MTHCIIKKKVRLQIFWLSLFKFLHSFGNIFIIHQFFKLINCLLSLNAYLNDVVAYPVDTCVEAGALKLGDGAFAPKFKKDEAKLELIAVWNRRSVGDVWALGVLVLEFFNFKQQRTPKSNIEVNIIVLIIIIIANISESLLI